MSESARPPFPATLTALIACVLLAPAVADAHISLHPNTIPEGAFATLSVRVPGEQRDAFAYKVDMLMPPGLIDVATQTVPGWSVREVTRKLANPIQTGDGPVTEEVSRVVWTGDRTRLGRLDDGTFIGFPLSIAIPEHLSGHSLAFKAVEYYSNGKAVHWIGSASAEFPAATINITPKGGVIEDVAGAEAGPAPGQPPAGEPATPSAPDSVGGASEGLARTALVLGALGLIAGLAAIVLARRGTRSGAARP